MKLIAFLSLILFSTNIYAQSVILLEQDSVSQVYEDVDLSILNKYYSVDFFYKNNTAENIAINWKREFNSNCPTDWDVISSDQFYSYVPNVNESLVAIEMTPVDSHFIMNFSFRPNLVPGCCDGKVIFSLDGDEDNPIDTGYFHIEINANDCIITSTSDRPELDFEVFPNPVKNDLSISSKEDIKEYQIYNASGRLIMKGAMKNKHIDTSPLTNGVYFLHLTSVSEKRNIKRIVKID